jgi:ABC-type uncharacterized transport system substrate-binding protein
MTCNNKRIRNVLGIVLLTLLLLFPCFAIGEDDPKQVVFIRYNLKDKPNSAVIKSFKKTMEKRGYTEGENINYIDFVTHTPERESAEEILDITEKYMPTADMFITTSWTSLYVRSRLAKSKVPQLFAPALKATALNMLPSVETEPGTNLSGVYLMFPPEKILRLTRHIFPKLRKYAYVYDSRLPADIIFKAAYGQLNELERYGITVYYLDLASGTDTVLQKMNKMGIEAFGGIVGVLQNLPELSQSKLPIITSLLFDRPRKALEKSIEKSNIIAGLFNPFDYCGKQTAEMTANIFEAKTTIEKTIPQPAQQLVFVNLKAAKRLNVNVPFSALEAVDIVIK